MARPGVAVAALTLAAFVLRALTLGQSPFGDELFTLAVIADGPGGVLEGIERHELNPPLFYYLAALGSETGDPLIWARLPSLVLGTASVPLVWVLGRRTVGDAAGAVAAGFLALSPFLLFYATEARGYAAAMFFVLGSTVALLAALRSGGLGAWVIFWAASTAALYTHYTAAFPLAVQAGWALFAHRERWRGLVIAEVAVAVAWLPWLPRFLDQSDAPALITGVSLRTFLESVSRAAAGQPFVSLGDFLGGLARAALALAALAALAGAGFTLVRRRHIRPSPGLVLVVALALAAPVGILAQGIATGEGLLYARNMSVSIPAGALLAGAVVVTAPRPLALLAGVATMLVLAYGALKLLDPEWQRPNTRAAAHYVDDRAAPGDPVVQVPGYLLFATAGPAAETLLVETPLAHDIDRYFERPHRLVGLEGFRRRPPDTVEAVASPRAWEEGRRAGRVFVLGVNGRKKLPLPARLGLARPPSGEGWRLAGRRTFDGFVDVSVLTYAPERP